MFREIKTSERMTEQDRRMKEELERQRKREDIQRIAGRHYSDEENQKTKDFWNNLFM